MRKLGKSQSVVFCVPPEVQRQITEISAQHIATRSLSVQSASSIGVLEILHWSIGENIIDLQKSVCLWAVQGQRFDQQEVYWKEALTNDGVR